MAHLTTLPQTDVTSITEFPPRGPRAGFLVSPVGVWTTAHTAPQTADNGGATITKMSEVEDTGKAVEIGVGGRGTSVQIRLSYDDGCTPNVDPVVEVFAIDPNGAVQKLRNRLGEIAGTLTTDTTNDAEDGTNKFTTPDDGQVYDMAGAESLVVAVKTAFTVSAGVATSTIQVKII